VEELDELRPRVERCFQAGALATGCGLEIAELSPRYSDYVADEPLLAAWRANARSVGRVYGADDAGAPPATASTDMANVSRAVPTIHPLVGLETNGAVVHEPAFAAAAAGPGAERALVDGAVLLAWTAIDAATDPALRRHLEERASQRPGW
jgi:metal-dependent amidase/aminoacylase/carboxypeptidase family protein